MRKIILISLLLIVFPIELTLLAVAAHDIPPPGVTGRFVFLHESDSSEFPSMPLLQTALAGYDLLLKEESLQYNIKSTSNSFLDDLLKKVPDLTEKEKASLADHLEFAMKLIEKERQERAQEKK